MTEEPREYFPVRKIVHHLPISDELLHPERYPLPKVSRWRRLQWRWGDYKTRLVLAWDVLRDRHECGDFL